MSILTRNPSVDWMLTPEEPPSKIASSTSADHNSLARSGSQSGSFELVDPHQASGVTRSPVAFSLEEKSRALALQAAAKGAVSPPASSPTSCASGEDVEGSHEISKKRKLESLVEAKQIESGCVSDEEEEEVQGAAVVDLTVSSPTIATANTAKRPKTESSKARFKLSSTAKKNAEASSSKSTIGSSTSTSTAGKSTSTAGKVKGSKQGVVAGHGRKERQKSATAVNNKDGEMKQRDGGKNKSDVNAPLIDLKPKRLALIQKPLSPPLSKYSPFMDLLKLFQRWMREQDADEVITELPEHFWALVVMGGMESSDPTPKALAKSLQKLLIDDQIDSEEGELAELATKALMTVIGQVLTLETYGFHPSDFQASSASGQDSSEAAVPFECKIPDAYALPRWEVVDVTQVPAENKMREKYINRKGVRAKARQQAQHLAQSLTNEQATEILGCPGSAANKTLGQDMQTAMETDAMDVEEPASEVTAEVFQDEDEAEGVEGSRAGSAAPSTTRSASPEKGKKTGRPKKEETEEQREKRIAKENRKSAKEAAEARAADAKAKSAALMQSFLMKPKQAASPAGGRSPRTSEAGPSSPVMRGAEVGRRDRSASRPQGEEAETSHFEETFKGFAVKLNCVQADINYFKASAQVDETIKRDLSSIQTSADELLQSFLAMSRKQAAPPRTARSKTNPTTGPKLKTEVLYMTIPELLIKGQEADDPRTVYASLRDGRKFPMKTLSFHEDSRPAYHGTWAKSSAFVGPRTPFAMDPVLDYSIDEGPDWEAPEGDDQDIGDGLNDDASEKSGSESSEDDLDGWLCDDSEIEMMDGFDAGFSAGLHPMDIDEGFLPPPSFKTKGKRKDKVKSEDKEQEKPKKGEPHRKVDKLVQFQCGPIWEDVIGEEIGHKAYKGFEQYQIRLLNDTPGIGIDPWNWISADVKPASANTANEASILKPINANAAVSTTHAVAGLMGPPAAPVEKVKAPSVKSTFPYEHLSTLLNTIQGSDKSAAELLKEIYAKFEGKATKSSMKSKFETVASRTGARSGTWSVSAEGWAEAKVQPRSA